MDPPQATPLIGDNPRSGNATHDVFQGNYSTLMDRYPTCNRRTQENTKNSATMAGPGTSYSRFGGPSSAEHNRHQLRKVLQKEETTVCSSSRTTSPGINNHLKPEQNELYYVLCSPCFTDIVVIHPPNIDNCKITDNYEVPPYNQVRNAYFKMSKIQK